MNSETSKEGRGQPSMMDRFRPDELKVARLSRGLNLREAAALTGITKETLSTLERGERFPQAHTLKKIADGYGLPVEYFLYTREDVSVLPKAEAPSTPETSAEEEQRGMKPVGRSLELRWNVEEAAGEILKLLEDRYDVRPKDPDRFRSGLEELLRRAA
jgi:transcriptional regulator with XRE-family HTH domain